MDKICGTTLVLAEHTTHLCCFGLHENIEIEARNYAHLVTEMFDTLTLILKQVEEFEIYNDFSTQKLCQKSILEPEK